MFPALARSPAGWDGPRTAKNGPWGRGTGLAGRSAAPTAFGAAGGLPYGLPRRCRSRLGSAPVEVSVSGHSCPRRDPKRVRRPWAVLLAVNNTPPRTDRLIFKRWKIPHHASTASMGVSQQTVSSDLAGALPDAGNTPRTDALSEAALAAVSRRAGRAQPVPSPPPRYQRLVTRPRWLPHSVAAQREAGRRLLPVRPRLATRPLKPRPHRIIGDQ